MDLKHIGKYDILDKLGEGGFGAVFLAQDTKLKRLIALKILHAQVASDEMLAAYFEREALALARLEHQNIVRVYDYDRIDGLNFIAMEYIDGTNLDKILRDRKSLSPAEALPIFDQLLSALGFAHKGGVVHRDIKPSNIMITKTNVVKITDFGIAKVTGSAKLTRTGTGAGSLLYMSPEQNRGKDIDNRSDLYSVGVTLYQVLTGRTPFEAETDYEIMTGHLEKPAPPPREFRSSISGPVEQFILKSLEKKPEKRFQSAEEMSAALRQLPTSEMFDKTAVTPSIHGEKTVRTDAHSPHYDIHEPKQDEGEKSTGKGKIIGAAVAVIIIAVAAIFFLMQSGGEEVAKTMTFSDSLSTAMKAYSDKQFDVAEQNLASLSFSRSATGEQKLAIQQYLAASKLMNQKITEATSILKEIMDKSPDADFSDGRLPPALLRIWDELHKAPVIPGGVRLEFAGYERFAPVTIDFAGSRETLSSSTFTKNGLAPGEYAFHLEGNGMQPIQQKITVSDVIVSKAFTLVSPSVTPTGTLLVEVENYKIFEPVSVVFDGKSVQYEGQPIRFPDLNYGSYEVGIVTDIGRSTSNIEVNGAEVRKVFTPSQNMSKLRIASLVENNPNEVVAAQVYIDNEKIVDAETPHSTRLMQGPHKIWIDHPSYRTVDKPKFIDLRDDQLVELRLRKK